MTAHIIDGKAIALQIRQEVAEAAASFKAESGITPGLAAILVGDDPASHVYVRNKARACDEAGLFNEVFNLPSDTSEAELLDLVRRLNDDARFHGTLVQLPLPGRINSRRVLDSVSPDKDVDGLHPVNAGRLLAGAEGFVPCTPAGVQQLLLRTGNDPGGKHIVVVGRSDIVGKPVAAIMMQKKPGANATVTVCHSATKNLPSITRQADILVAAMGQPRFITADMVSEGAVVIDVGTNRIEDSTKKSGYRLVGDVDFDAVAGKVSAITPVPGGVGPMTIAMLLSNTLLSAKRMAAAV